MVVKNDIISIDNNFDEDDDWVTINGTPVPLKNGELKGEIGEKIKKESKLKSMIKDEATLKEFNETIQSLKSQGIVNENIGTADFPTPVIIKSVNSHAAKRMKERGITEKDAQSYIDNAMIMFNQNNNSKHLYISNDGNSAILVGGSRLLSAYSS